MNKSTMNSTTMTREEKRRAQARKNANYHSAKIQRQKDFLARHPEIAAQQAREKEEKRLNYETIRMLQSMKHDPPKKLPKTKNTFAAFCDDSETEEEEEPTAATHVSDEESTTFCINDGTARPRLNWADSDSEED
jgi:hypothetical protein